MIVMAEVESTTHTHTHTHPARQGNAQRIEKLPKMNGQTQWAQIVFHKVEPALTKQRKRRGEAEGRREEGESTPKELEPSAPEAARCPETDGKQKRQAATRWSPISFFVGCWFEMMHINKHTQTHTTDPHRRGRMEAVSQNYASQVNPDDRIRMDDDGWWIRILFLPGFDSQAVRNKWQLGGFVSRIETILVATLPGRLRGAVIMVTMFPFWERKTKTVGCTFSGWPDS